MSNPSDFLCTRQFLTRHIDWSVVGSANNDVKISLQIRGDMVGCDKKQSVIVNGYEETGSVLGPENILSVSDDRLPVFEYRIWVRSVQENGRPRKLV